MDSVIQAREALWHELRDDIGPNESWAEGAMTVVDKYVVAILNEIEGGALRATSIEVNDYFIGDVLDPLREKLKRVSRGIVP